MREAGSGDELRRWSGASVPRSYPWPHQLGGMSRVVNQPGAEIFENPRRSPGVADQVRRSGAAGPTADLLPPHRVDRHPQPGRLPR